MPDDFAVRPVNKGKHQNRVTIPKKWNTDYVAIKPLSIPNVFKEHDKYKK